MNNDLISREALQQEALKLALKYSEIDDYAYEVYEMIEHAPAVDAVEAKHGKWILPKMEMLLVTSATVGRKTFGILITGRISAVIVVLI